MSEKAVVEIIGAPVACAEGVKDTWREVAGWAAGQIKGLFGDAVEVVYYDLFDPDCPALAAGAQLPHVRVNQEVVTNGGKISVPAIRKRVMALGIEIKSRS